ncbi:MAG TPA: EcsC family protein [Acetobacteraceae bacterium]|jgi:hypothetical protein|nr:EcsC family protein [Acetobacteraceae bacterium]
MTPDATFHDPKAPVLVIAGSEAGTLPPAARAELRRALRRLRGGSPLARAAGMAARAASVATTPMLRFGLRAAGGRAGALQPTVEAVLVRAFDVAIVGLDDETPLTALTPLRARLAAALSGAAGGAAGVIGFFPDVAFTTLVILRSIARVARDEGEDLSDEAARRACLEVFAFGAPGARAAEAGEESEGYWTARLVLQGVPLMRLMTQAASRFGIALSQKLALQAVPVAGAAGGLLVNTAFLEHYRALAEGHFVIRRLERTYGTDAVRAAAG